MLSPSFSNTAKPELPNDLKGEHTCMRSTPAGRVGGGVSSNIPIEGRMGT
jgi:hypothetical protein